MDFSVRTVISSSGSQKEIAVEFVGHDLSLFHLYKDVHVPDILIFHP